MSGPKPRLSTDECCPHKPFVLGQYFSFFAPRPMGLFHGFCSIEAYTCSENYLLVRCGVLQVRRCQKSLVGVRGRVEDFYVKNVLCFPRFVEAA